MSTEPTYLWDLYRAGNSIAVAVRFLDLSVRLIPSGAFKGWWAVPTLQMYKVELKEYLRKNEGLNLKKCAKKPTLLAK